jgi:transposase
MKRFIEGESRQQVTLLPECLDDYIGEDNPVRIVDAFVEELDLLSLGFGGADPAATGRPAYPTGQACHKRRSSQSSDFLRLLVSDS